MWTQETLNSHSDGIGTGGPSGNLSRADEYTEAATGLMGYLTRIPLPRGHITRFLFEVVLIGVAYVAYQLVRGVVEGGTRS